MQKLTATAVKKTNPSTKPKKLSDGGGLYLLIQPNGSRYWRYGYRFAGKRKTLAIGVHPEMTLKEARERHLEAREILRQEIDPSEIKKIGKLTNTSQLPIVLRRLGWNGFSLRWRTSLRGTKRD